MILRELPALRAQIAIERGRLEQVAAEIESLRAATHGREPTRVEQVAAAAYLHNLYNAIENCLTRVAHGVDESVPTGPDSHRLLLDQLSAPIGALRPAVVGGEHARRLDEYRRFRHAFRHMYFFDLEWDRIEPLLAGTPSLVRDFGAALDGLFESLGVG